MRYCEIQLTWIVGIRLRWKEKKTKNKTKKIWGKVFFVRFQRIRIFRFRFEPNGFFKFHIQLVLMRNHSFFCKQYTRAICAKRIILLLFNIIVITIQLILDVKFMYHVKSEVKWIEKETSSSLMCVHVVRRRLTHLYENETETICCLCRYGSFGALFFTFLQTNCFLIFAHLLGGPKRCKEWGGSLLFSK